MPDSSENDESVFEPQAGLRRTFCLAGCDESIAPSCSSFPSVTTQKLKAPKLSLSQQKRQVGTLFGRKDESLHIQNSVCQNGTVSPNFNSQNCLSGSSYKKKSKRPRFSADLSCSSDDSIPPSQNVPKKILRRSDRLESSQDFPSSSVPSQEVVPTPSILLSPIKCRQGTRCRNDSRAHFTAYVHVDSSPSVESLGSTVISLGIVENDRMRELDDTVKATDIEAKPVDESKLDVPSVQMSTFSANSSTKEDFIQHWVDSCEIETFANISENSETQPLPDTVLDPLLTVPELSIENHEEEESRNEMICQSIACTSPGSHRSTQSRGMVTPFKKKQSSAMKPSRSSDKQSAITAFFTPCNSTPAKLNTMVDISQVQSRTAIDELNTTLTDGCEIQTESEVINVDELEVTVAKKDSSSSSLLSSAKEQWSYIMSRMKMRGTATNLQREMKKVEKEKAILEPKRKVFAKTSVEAGPSTAQRKCPFYKRIPGTGFAIDAFWYGTVDGVSSYFLSHFHYDHYRGLGKWLKKPLYCSQVTANLINLKMKLDPGIIRVLPLNESRIIENIEVILIDANHCPGSVMFLFRFPTGKVVLHVGDFRAHPSMERLYELKQRPIDELYLDTTYCDEHYELPAQEEVLSYIRRLVRRYANKHQKLLVVSGTYTIGKEKVFMMAAEELNSKVWAPTEKRRILNCLEDLAISGRLSNDPREASVHVVNMGDVKPANLKQYLDSLKGAFTHILALNPTGWEYDGRMAMKGLDAIPPRSYHNSIFIHGVPYSEHSGFSEMKRFVRFFRPRKIIPTVNMGSAAQRQKMETIFTAWLGHPAPY